MDVEIRSARSDDACFLAWVILTAGRSHCQRGIWDVILGRPEEECLAFLERLAVTETPHTFHYSGFIVAEVDGRPVAALSGYDPKELGLAKVMLGIQEARQKMRLTESDWMSNRKGIAAILACLPDEAEGAWIIESVATLPEFRRRGLVSRLLEEILQKGRGQGSRLAQVSVFIGNMPAQNAYEKCGFKVVDEKRHPDFEAETGCPGVARLLRDL